MRGKGNFYDNAMAETLFKTTLSTFSEQVQFTPSWSRRANHEGQSMNQLSLSTLAGRSVAPKDFVNEISNFAEFGKATSIEDIDGIRYFVNEFWTAGQRQAHSIHEISYRACFKAQLPAFFI